MRAAATRIPVLAVALALALGGCGGDDDAPERPVPPASAGLSPQREVRTPTLERSRVARGFAEPVSLVQEPGRRGRVLVVERAGTARWLDGDGPAGGTPFLDLRGRVSTKDEQGLLGLVFVGDGRGGVQDRVVVHESDQDGRNRVVRYPVRDGRVDVAAGEPLLDVEQPYANHNGGEPVIGPDGRLYVGLGDGGSAYDPRQKAQDRTSMLGKILSTDPDARSPRWRQVAIGLRNPWRLSFDARTGALWVADAGRDSAESQTEEIDRIPASALRRADEPANLGWSAYEGARVQRNRTLTTGLRLIWPVASYTQRDGCNAVGGLALRGAGAAAVPALRDRYVFGDTCSGLVWSLPADAGLGAELRREGVRVPRQTSYLLDRRGRLLVSSLDGTVHRLRDAG
ncbi:sorbosone dehydrogenase family protein [Patulibacter sp.]|uniref:PQQ-dependent sugar dehydrogenase n=1 Tax=Patulibacter sp. TaxID=1912859 RepID=UPI0027238CEE|nr:PQQ-dependent sugar dehydrogenase [Patulibacter sp.]MDO9407097.1 PQQ-dependent sugar dehydrogenase [Patulibacter sp.]